MKLADICVRHPVFAVMLIAFLVTLGVFSYRGLAVDLFPKADPATVNVDVQLPGATPDEMITGVVLPLEDAISSVSGIDEISVYASEGRADITCTFVLEREIEVFGEAICRPEASRGHSPSRRRSAGGGKSNQPDRSS